MSSKNKHPDLSDEATLVIACTFLGGIAVLIFYLLSNHVSIEPPPDKYLDFCQQAGFETYSDTKIAETSWQRHCLSHDKPRKLVSLGENGQLYLEP